MPLIRSDGSRHLATAVVIGVAEMPSDSSDERRHRSEPAASHYMRWPSGSRAARVAVMPLLKCKSFSRGLFSMAHPSLLYSIAPRINDRLCGVIGCYGNDINSAAAAAEGAKDKDGGSYGVLSLSVTPVPITERKFSTRITLKYFLLRRCICSYIFYATSQLLFYFVLYYRICSVYINYGK